LNWDINPFSLKGSEKGMLQGLPDYSFNYEAFIAAFPAFSDPLKFPELTLQGYWDASTGFISPINYGVFAGAARNLGLNLLTAHLTQISVLIRAGKTPLILNSGSIDKVSVGVVPPPFGTSTFSWWLQTTPYGSELDALLAVKTRGGWMVGGTPEGLAFKTYGGGFGGNAPFNYGSFGIFSPGAPCSNDG
jgi:hypothetical protein